MGFNYYSKSIEEKFLIDQGQLLFAWSGTPGTSFGAHIWNGRRAVLNQHIFKVEFDDCNINKKYFCYAINEKLNELIEKAHGGVGLRHVTKGIFEETEIAIPPLSEQKRIVAKIEELFSELDNATKCLLSAKEQQKIFYQSVLDNAFSNCKEHKKLEDLLSQKLSNGYSGKPVGYETNYRVLSLSSTTSGVFLDSYFKFLDEPTLEDRDIWCAPNDILIQRGNTIEYVGVPAIFTGMPRRFIFPDLMIRARANENLISTKFLYYALSSPKIRNYLRQKAKGSAGTMPKINQSILASLPIPFCSKETQEKIVEDIEEKLSNGLALERTIEESLSMSEVLRQSILKKAFSGRLVAQDQNDEPASVLLERIRAEKEAQKTESKKPKAKREAA